MTLSSARPVLRPIRFDPPHLAAASRTQRPDELDARLSEALASARIEGLQLAQQEVDEAVARHDAARHELERAAAALLSAADELRSRDQVFTTELEESAVRFALQIAEEVLGRELRRCDDGVVTAICRAASLVPDRGTVTLRVHPDDLVLATAATGETAGLAGRAEIVADQVVAPGGCIAVVGPLRIDTQVGPAIERVRAALEG